MAEPTPDELYEARDSRYWEARAEQAEAREARLRGVLERVEHQLAKAAKRMLHAEQPLERANARMDLRAALASYDEQTRATERGK